MFKTRTKTKENNNFQENKKTLPKGLMYADVAALTDGDITEVNNFTLRCIHKEYVVGYITATPTGDKYFSTVMETKVRTFPYFDNVTEAEVGLEFVEDKNFVINAHSITSFGITEPVEEADVYNTLSKHSMNFRFLDADRLEKEKHGRLYERK